MKNLIKKLFSDDSRPASTESIEQQIFNDVYSAHGFLLAEAQRIISNPPTFTKEKEARLKQLKSLGFNSFDEVTQLEKEQTEYKKHNDLQRIIRYYQMVYPFNRFISQDSVQAILKKYKLVLAHAGDYIAEIPEKNQKEIIDFKVMRKDVRDPDEMNTGMWHTLLLPPSFGWGDAIFGRSYDEERFRVSIANDPDYIAKKKAAARKAFEEKKAKDREKIPGKDLLIIAPEHKLDMRNKYVKNGIVMKTKDPIVLQPVVLGYLIVSSWGLESGDELVVNKVNN